MFVSKPALARHHGICTKSVDNWVSRGWLPAPTRGPNGRQRWPADIIKPVPADDLAAVAASMDADGNPTC